MPVDERWSDVPTGRWLWPTVPRSGATGLLAVLTHDLLGAPGDALAHTEGRVGGLVGHVVGANGPLVGGTGSGTGRPCIGLR